MNFKDYKIAYWPNTPSLTAAGDRRRFVFYANERQIKFSHASSKEKYDIVYLCSNCNCSEWIRYKKNNPDTKIIFELIDSYLLEDLNLRSFFRGPARYFRGKENHLYLDYRNAFKKMVSVADAVVCSTPLQREHLLRYNSNVHISLDYFSNDILERKQNYSTAAKLKLVWEGQSYTVHNLLAIADVFHELRDDIELHIITDEVIKLPFKVFNKKTSQVLKKLPCEFFLHPWERKTFSSLIAACDLAIIPMHENDKLGWNKPENKLLLLWETGIPVFISPTPAYQRVMRDAGLDGTCANADQWIKKISDYKMKTAEEKQTMASIAENYLQKHHTKEIILAKWDAIFESVNPLGSLRSRLS